MHGARDRGLNSRLGIPGKHCNTVPSWRYGAMRNLHAALHKSVVSCAGRSHPAVDAAIAKSDRTLAGETTRRPERDPLVYDLDWDEDARIEDWQRIVDRTRTLPPALAAAITADAWDRVEPLQHMPWLGRLLASAVLRARGKTRWHLSLPPCRAENHPARTPSIVRSGVAAPDSIRGDDRGRRRRPQGS